MLQCVSLIETRDKKLGRFAFTLVDIEVKKGSAFLCFVFFSLPLYSRVSNKRPGRLLFLSLYALGTYKTSGTYNLFDPFLAFGTINKYF